MYKIFLKAFLKAALLVSVVAGCDVDEPMIIGTDSSEGDGEVGAASEKAFDDYLPARTISLYLQPQLPNSHTAVLDRRVVTAEPVYPVPASMARAQGLTDGVDVVYVGKSCSGLMARYPDLYNCVEEETVEFEYGETIATVETNSEGFASIVLGGAEKYRLRVQSWATEEDAKCYWGGEETIDASESEIKIPLLVFCE